jgi:hypothetical protein
MSTFATWLKAQSNREDQVGELARLWSRTGDTSRSVAGVQRWATAYSSAAGEPWMIPAMPAAVAEYEASRTPGSITAVAQVQDRPSLAGAGTITAPVAVPDIPGWAEPSEGVAWGGGGPGAAERLVADRAPHPVTAAIRDAGGAVTLADGTTVASIGGRRTHQSQLGNHDAGTCDACRHLAGPAVAVQNATAAGLAAAQAHESPAEPGDRLQRLEDQLAEMHVLLLVLVQSIGLPELADGEPDHAALWAAADFSGSE